MYKLFLDTSYKYLTIVLLNKDNKIVLSYSKECFKKQSEELFEVLDELFSKNNIVKKDIDSVYITEGPGSYTGVRISLTLAKVLCSIKKNKLYKISTLKLYASNNPNTMVIMDARAKRAYVGIYDKGKTILKDQVMNLSDIDVSNYNVVLDGSLINKENNYPDIVDCFINCLNDFEEVSNIDSLTPKYLKESENYYR